LTRGDQRLLLLDQRDNVLLATTTLGRGEVVRIGGETVTLGADLAIGHKVARRPIAAGEKILKYGAPIGTARSDIAAGAHVHVHNLASDYTATHTLDAARAAAGQGSPERDTGP
jgi:hypothetical protein